MRGHYEAIGTGDFGRAYSYFDPTYWSMKGEEAWIIEEKSFQIIGSTINALKVS